MTSLRDLLSGPAAIDEIEGHLDGLAPADRLAEVRALPGKALAALYERAAGRDTDLAHFVPPDVPDGTPVHHLGINSLPLFRVFEKRFLRLPGQERLVGYNHQAMAPLTGPGYFVVDRPEPGQPVAIDYFQVPDERPHPDWPAVAPNTTLRSRFVYGFMKDFMRRVTGDVSIGRANRKGKDQSAWFALVRA